jgi:hypothetical protein
MKQHFEENKTKICIVFFLCWVPVADVPGCTAACRFNVQPEILRRSNLHHQVMPTTLAVKGGTIGRQMGGKFDVKVAS